ncbi:MAG: GTP cyclohydrolase I FolE [Bacteroidetes bacterium]|jgi:GTP cyclohydrolase I|nr:GTP cyclohydrolase I FolE [Bacteroidota bacterium]
MDIKTLEEMMARGESHAGNLNTPIRQDAFELTNEEKIELIAKNFRQIMLTLGLDLEDDSLKGTPMRVAKMYVEEIFSGLNPANLPKATLFENKYDYRQMLVEKNITVHSMCEHHFVPIVGYAHVAYISSGQVIGLSKINRIVRHFGRRPQVQERLTREIANHLRQVLNTEDVAVVIDAKHYCVAMRGIEDQASTTITAEYTGAFQDPDRKREFLQHIAHTA